MTLQPAWWLQPCWTFPFGMARQFVINLAAEILSTDCARVPGFCWRERLILLRSRHTIPTWTDGAGRTMTFCSVFNMFWGCGATRRALHCTLVMATIAGSYTEKTVVYLIGRTLLRAAETTTTTCLWGPTSPMLMPLWSKWPKAPRAT